MRRRDFIFGLGGAAASPLAAHAQSPDRGRRLGVLMARSPSDPEAQKQLGALHQGLEELGWTPGRNLQVEHRWQVGDTAKALAYARELVGLHPDVLVANATPSLIALRQVTRTISIVFVSVADPVGQGFVPSLARPGGNITGFSVEEPDMGGKWLQLLKEIAPRAARITIIFNPETAPYAPMFLPSMQAAAPPMAVELSMSPVRTAADVERVITAIGREQNPGLIVLPDSYMFGQRHLIIELASKLRVPAVYPIQFYVTSGGLVAYGIDRVDLFRRAASYVDRILKGAAPSELPVQQPTKFELAVNLKTAEALGLTVPPALLTRADGVIE